jgi:ATP-dependent Lhr-like helicase
VSFNPFYRLAPFLQEFIYRNAWDEIRPVQIAACEAIFETDNHLLLSSGTASGKTEAAFLPSLTLLHEDPPDGLGILYVSPLKALINDQFERVGEMLRDAQIPVWHWHGDVSASHKAKLIKSPHGVLQTTPESLESILLNRTVHLGALFGDLRFVIIDEMHAFMESDRGLQLLCQLERLQEHTERPPRRIGLSATLGDIEQGKAWLRAGTSRDVSAPVSKPPKRNVRIAIDHFLVDPDQDKPDARDETDRCWDFIFESTFGKKCIVFSNSRSDAEDATASLRERARERGAQDVYHVHHGDISGALRTAAEEALRNDASPAVVAATSTLELGLDIGSLDRVIQIDAPFAVSSFVQRLGRSGRRGQPAELYFASRDDLDAAGSAIGSLPWTLLRAIAIVQIYVETQWIEAAARSRLPFSLLYHQTMSTLASVGDLTPADLARRVLTLSPFERVSQDDFRSLLRHLIEIDHVHVDEAGKLLVGLTGERVVRNFRFYAVFTDNSEFRVVPESRAIGTIQEAPALDQRIRLAGRSWVVTHVDQEKRVVVVKPVSGTAVAGWRGESGLVHTRVMRQTKEILQSDEQFPYLSDLAATRLREARVLARSLGVSNQLLAPLGGSRYALYGWMGTTAYRTLAAISQTELGKSFGVEVNDRNAPRFGVLASKHGDVTRTKQALIQMVSSFEPGSELLADTIDPITDKYDPYVPKILRRMAYTSDHLDISELRAIAETWG